MVADNMSRGESFLKNMIARRRKWLSLKEAAVKKQHDHLGSQNSIRSHNKIVIKQASCNMTNEVQQLSSKSNNRHPGQAGIHNAEFTTMDSRQEHSG